MVITVQRSKQFNRADGLALYLKTIRDTIPMSS